MIATGTAMLLAAGVAAAGSAGAAKIGSDANKRGADAQSRATQDALAFEREKEATRKAQYDQQMQQYQQQMAVWNQNRLGMMKRYGINIPAGAGGGNPLAAVGRPAAAPVAAPTPAPSSGGGLGAGLGLGLVGLGAAGKSLADLWNWNGQQKPEPTLPPDFRWGGGNDPNIPANYSGGYE